MPKEPGLEARLAALEARNRELEAELSRLRHLVPPAPKAEPHARMLPGQGGLFDRMGNRVHLPGQEPVDPASTTVGASGGFGSPWRTDPDTGVRRYMPDGVERDPVSGEAVARGAVDRTIPTGPARTYAHQQNVELVDRLFPVTPAPRSNKGD